MPASNDRQLCQKILAPVRSTFARPQVECAVVKVEQPGIAVERGGQNRNARLGAGQNEKIPNAVRARRGLAECRQRGGRVALDFGQQFRNAPPDFIGNAFRQRGNPAVRINSPAFAVPDKPSLPRFAPTDDLAGNA